MKLQLRAFKFPRRRGGLRRVVRCVVRVCQKSCAKAGGPRPSMGRPGLGFEECTLCYHDKRGTACSWAYVWWMQGM